MKFRKILGTAVLAFVLASTLALAEKPGVLRPWDDGLTSPDVGRPAGAAAALTPIGMQPGADHIVGQQCVNGGFGWPHDDCSATYNNITAPICMGLLRAYGYTGDAAHMTAVTAGAAYDLTSQYSNGEARFGTFAAHFLWQTTLATGDNQYANFATTGLFDQLAAGTYGPSDLDTAGWILAVQTARTGTWVNLRPWEFHNLVQTAAAIGNAGQSGLFLQGVLDGLNTLDNSAPATVYSDIIGLAGGVSGLSAAGMTSFPAIVSPNHPLINNISTLKGLADALAGLQNGDGSWYWHSNLGTPTVGDKDTQTSAYAVMALLAADPLVTSDYTAAIVNGRSWLLSMQTVDGGFLSWPGGTENTETEGEALTAIVMSARTAGIPTVSEWGLIVLALSGLVVGSIMFARKFETDGA